jgi:hypothetical protein
MKNSNSGSIVLVLLAFAALGCSSINPFSGSSETQPPAGDRTITDRTVDQTAGRTSTGIPECDEVSNLIEAELNNPDDNFMIKAAKATILNRIKDGIRESVERNQNEPVELAKTCREYKKQFEKFKAEQDAKKGEPAN